MRPAVWCAAKTSKLARRARRVPDFALCGFARARSGRVSTKRATVPQPPARSRRLDLEANERDALAIHRKRPARKSPPRVHAQISNSPTQRDQKRQPRESGRPWTLCPGREHATRDKAERSDLEPHESTNAAPDEPARSRGVAASTWARPRNIHVAAAAAPRSIRGPPPQRRASATPSRTTDERRRRLGRSPRRVAGAPRRSFRYSSNEGQLWPISKLPAAVFRGIHQRCPSLALASPKRTHRARKSTRRRVRYSAELPQPAGAPPRWRVFSV